MKRKDKLIQKEKRHATFTGRIYAQVGLFPCDCDTKMSRKMQEEKLHRKDRDQCATEKVEQAFEKREGRIITVHAHAASLSTFEPR